MDFNEFHRWVHRELGINLCAYKPEQLNRRINSLMTRVGIKSLDEYTKVIKTDSEQRQKFLDFITINVTEFFRNPELYSELENKVKSELLTKGQNLKVWSAACSIGCEPYTLAIILDRISPTGRHNIIATDIDNTILTKAKTFKKHDLILDRYDKDFDLIVCRNVVIYFNNDVKQEIYKKFSESLKKGGLLFVGATESIYNYRDYGFEKASTFIYKKI